MSAVDTSGHGALSGLEQLRALMVTGSRQPPMGETAKAFWTASVRKMQTAYGSDMSAEDAAKIVAYLAETYR